MERLQRTKKVETTDILVYIPKRRARRCCCRKSHHISAEERLPLIQGNDNLLGRLKLAEGHIEAGRILAFYQVPKPISFFLEAHADEKSVKQIFRLILSKFIRRQLSQSDNDWESMWRDMQFLQEKVFIFLEPEYMLREFCRGLLKGGDFSLARNYLKGTSVVTLASDKAENLVIQAAREYFFSASSLASSEVGKSH